MQPLRILDTPVTMRYIKYIIDISPCECTVYVYMYIYVYVCVCVYLGLCARILCLERVYVCLYARVHI